MLQPSLRSDSDETAVLRELVQMLVRASRSYPWQEPLVPALQFAVRSAYFMLDSDQQGDDVETFIIYILPRLLRSPRTTTTRSPKEYQGQAHARILWPATYKARYGQDFAPNRYICREVRNRYDTPENQLLKYMLEQLDICLQSIPTVQRRGSCYFADGQPAKSTHQRLEHLETVLHNSRRNQIFSMISLPSEINSFHLVQAERANMVEYTQLARLYLRYQEIVVADSWDAWLSIGRRVLLLPERMDDGGKLWVQFGAALLQMDQYETQSNGPSPHSWAGGEQPN